MLVKRLTELHVNAVRRDTVMLSNFTDAVMIGFYGCIYVDNGLLFYN